jgi:hypothetical protein
VGLKETANPAVDGDGIHDSGHYIAEVKAVGLEIALAAPPHPSLASPNYPV